MVENFIIFHAASEKNHFKAQDVYIYIEIDHDNIFVAYIHDNIYKNG